MNYQRVFCHVPQHMHLEGRTIFFILALSGVDYKLVCFQVRIQVGRTCIVKT